MKCSTLTRTLVAAAIVPLLGAATAAAQPCGSPMWTPVATTGPSPRSDYAMAYDAARGNIVLFGGYDGTANEDDTWIWDGTSWSERVVPGPAPRNGHEMVFDSSSQKVVLFGGNGNGGGRLGDTWEWDGFAWNEPPPLPPLPPARSFFGMAYASSRNRVVIQGGSLDNNATAGDTWERTGTTWMLRNLNPNPGQRSAHAMTFDSGRGQVVVYGGSSGLTDTWEWGGGGSWMLRASAGATGNSQVAMAFHPGQQRVFAYGGISRLGFVVGGTWQWDGASWTQVLVTDPGPRARHKMVYDSTNQVLVTFGGLSPNGDQLGDTWTFSISGGTVITSPPSDVTARAGGRASFSVLINSPVPATYQWRRNGLDVPGANSAIYTIPLVAPYHAGMYDVVVSSSCGTTTSPAAQLTVQGQIGTFFDTEFENTEWTVQKILDTTPGQNGTTANEQRNPGGNPDAYRWTFHGFTGPGGVGFAHRHGCFAFNPAIHGAVTSLDVSFDAIFPIFVNPGGIGYAFLIFQGAAVYGAPSTFRVVTQQSWVSYRFDDGPGADGPALRANDFGRLAGVGPEQPDFSASGAPISFGYYTSNGSADNVPIQTNGGIDNWSVLIHHDPPPNPTFSDGTFDPSNWTQELVFDNTGNNATFTVEQRSAGGNPGFYRHIVHDWTGPGGLYVFHRRNGYLVNPAVGGGIGAVEITFDAFFAPFVDPYAVGYAPLVYQNGQVFVADGVADITSAALTNTRFTGLTARGFHRFGGSGPQHPDFSAAGQPIAFGFYTANGDCCGSHLVTNSGIDNFTIAVYPCACTADFNGDHRLNSQDFFDFITAFFAGDGRADFNADGIVNSQDFFDFLTAFFTGC